MHTAPLRRLHHRKASCGSIWVTSYIQKRASYCSECFCFLLWWVSSFSRNSHCKNYPQPSRSSTFKSQSINVRDERDFEMRKSNSWNWKWSSREIKCPFLQGAFSEEPQGSPGLLILKGVRFPVKVLGLPQHSYLCHLDPLLPTSVTNGIRKTVADSNTNSRLSFECVL